MPELYSHVTRYTLMYTHYTAISMLLGHAPFPTPIDVVLQPCKVHLIADPSPSNAYANAIQDTRAQSTPRCLDEMIQRARLGTSLHSAHPNCMLSRRSVSVIEFYPVPESAACATVMRRRESSRSDCACVSPRSLAKSTQACHRTSPQN